MKSIIHTFKHNKTYYLILVCIFFLSFGNNAYSKKIELSKYFSFNGVVDNSGSPQGKGKLELTYYTHSVSPTTGNDESKVKKDVLEGIFENGSIQSAELLIERYNSPLWITSASFKGKMKYEFGSSMSYIQYTLEEGVFKDSKFNKIVIMPGKPLVIRRTPTDNKCITQVLSPGFLLTEEFELEEIEVNTSLESMVGNKGISSLAKYIPGLLSYNTPSYCKSIVDWVSKSQKKQRYLGSWGAQWITTIKNLWSKTGSGYVSRKFYDNSRFTAARGFHESYSDPYEGLLHHDEGEYSFSLTKSLLTYTNKDQIQVACETHPKTGKPLRPSDGAKESFGCKTGTRNAIAQVLLMGKPLKIKYTVTCNHSTYQSSYFNVVYGDGTPVNQSRGGHDQSINRGVRPNGTRVQRNDDYAPWRQIHNQTVKYNLDEIARLNNISKKELVSLMILTPTWNMPLLSDKSKMGYSAKWESIDLEHGYNIDHAVLIHFLWKQFGITEEYLNDYIKKMDKQRKDTIYSVTSPYIKSTKLLLEIAEASIHADEQKGLDNYKKSVDILSEAYTVCQDAGLTELTDSIRTLLKGFSVSQLYYASKYGIQMPNLELPACLSIINNNPPKEGAIVFLSECRDNAFSNGYYNQVLMIANYLRPLLLNQSEKVIEQVLFNNYYKTICALLKQDKYSEALDIANEYIGNTPNSVLPYENLCYIYAYQNNKKYAMEIWKNHLLKGDKKYAKNHQDSPVCILLEQRGWIKIK